MVYLMNKEENQQSEKRFQQGIYSDFAWYIKKWPKKSI